MNLPVDTKNEIVLYNSNERVQCPFGKRNCVAYAGADSGAVRN
jgi:hypothetical protein